MSTSARKTAQFLVTIAAVCAVAGGVAFSAGNLVDRGTRSAGAGEADSRAAVESAFAQAMTVHMLINVPGALGDAATAIKANRGRAAVAAALQAGPRGRTGNATRSQVLQHLAETRTTIPHVFTNRAASTEAASLENLGVMLEDPDFRSLDSGIGRIIVKGVDINGDTATETAEVETWARMQMRNPDGTWVTSEPHTQLAVVMIMTRDDSGAWLVDDLTWEFANGSGP